MKVDGPSQNGILVSGLGWLGLLGEKDPGIGTAGGPTGSTFVVGDKRDDVGDIRTTRRRTRYTRGLAARTRTKGVAGTGPSPGPVETR